MKTHGLQIAQTYDGWSIHRAEATDEDIAEGTALGAVILSGPGVPSQVDFDTALTILNTGVAPIQRFSF